MKRIHWSLFLVWLLLSLILGGQRVLAEEIPLHIQWVPENADVPISIDADIECNAYVQAPSYIAQLQTWKFDAIERFSDFDLLESGNSPQIFDLGNGCALLFDEVTYESIVFLIDPNATWRYMNGRAEACYVNAMEGIYTQDTYDKNQLSAFLSPNSKLHDFVQGAIKALEGIGIEVGEPLQMTAYYVFQEDRPPVKYEPAFIEIAFERLIDEIRLIPWGQETRRKEITPKSYITMYIDAEGVSNILVPLVFETCKKSSPKEILSLDQAIEALNKHLESLIFPTFESKMIIDFIALEYIPFPATIDCLDINLKPVWSFYINYLRDEDRQVICIDAYTGEPVK